MHLPCPEMAIMSRSLHLQFTLLSSTASWPAIVVLLSAIFCTGLHHFIMTKPNGRPRKNAHVLPDIIFEIPQSELSQSQKLHRNMERLRLQAENYNLKL